MNDVKEIEPPVVDTKEVFDFESCHIHMMIVDGSLHIRLIADENDMVESFFVVTGSESNKIYLMDKALALYLALREGLPPVVMIGEILLDFSKATDNKIRDFFVGVNYFSTHKPKRNNTSIG